MSPAATVDFLGLEIATLPFEAVVAAIERQAGADDFAYIVTPNVDHVVRLAGGGETGAALAAAYDDAALVLCDSRVLARLARLSGLTLPLVAGSDLTAALFAGGHLAGRTVAIVGGDAALRAELARRYPAVRTVQHLPPMGVLRDPRAQAAIVDFVRDTGADVTFFAIGAPQSEILARQCRATPGTRGVGLCVGASLEFITDAKRRAPRWMQRLGIEWAHRLASEPRRLWRRYLVEGPRVFALWWRWQRKR